MFPNVVVNLYLNYSFCLSHLVEIAVVKTVVEYFLFHFPNTHSFWSYCELGNFLAIIYTVGSQKISYVTVKDSLFRRTSTWTLQLS